MTLNADPQGLARAFGYLLEEGVSFLVLGGIAMTLYGTGHMTEDLDILFEPTPENAVALLRALEASKYKGGVSHGPEVTYEDLTWAIEEGGTVRCYTNSGKLDCLGAIPLLGFPQFYELRERAAIVPLGGQFVPVISFEDLAENKRRVGRPKDKRALPEIADALKLRNDLRAKEGRGDGGL